MARYSASGRGLATAASGNLVSLRAPATLRAKVLEVGVFAEAATALSPALYLTSAIDTAGTAVTPQKEDSGEAASNCVVSTIPTGGTRVAVASRRAFMPAAAGAAVIWTMPGQIIVAPSLSIMLVNDLAVVGPAISWYIVWEE